MERDDTNIRYPKKGEAGSYEWHYKQYYSSIEPKGSRGRTHIVSPSIAFKTDKEPVVVLRNMLHILDNRDFEEVLVFDGPVVELPGSEGDRILTSDLVFALTDVRDISPPFRGFRCVMAHEKERDVRAKLKVGRTKTRLRIKGTIPRPVWDRICKDIKKKFHLKL